MTTFEKNLMTTGIFNSNAEMTMYLLVRSIGERKEPAGSWALKSDMDQLGINCSTATIGRHLKTLDVKELTSLQGNHGRILTPDGTAWLKDIEERLARARVHHLASREVRLTQYSELIDLISARKAIEVETARLAAIHATPEQIDLLVKNTELYHSYVDNNEDPLNPALDFHSIVAKCSKNRFMNAVFSILYFEQMALEKKHVVLYTREIRGIYIAEHRQIIEAFKNRDPDRASEYMRQHMEKLLSDVIRQVEDFESRRF